MAQSVKHLPSTPIKIPGSWNQGPHQGPCSRGEPASPSLSLCLSLLLLLQCPINKLNLKKNTKKTEQNCKKKTMVIMGNFFTILLLVTENKRTKISENTEYLNRFTNLIYRHIQKTILNDCRIYLLFRHRQDTLQILNM